MSTATTTLAAINGGIYNAATNPGGLDGPEGMEKNLVRGFSAMGTAGDEVAAHASQVATDAEQVAADKTTVTTLTSTTTTKTAEAVAARDAAASYAGQARGGIWVPASGVGGTANAITLAPTPAVTAYGAGVTLEFVAKAANAPVTRSNLVWPSSDFTVWTTYGGTATVTANTTAALDGTLTADTIADTDGTATTFAYKNVTVANDTSTYTFSVYLTQGTSATSKIRLSLQGGSTTLNLDCTINWTTHTATASGGAIAARLEPTSVAGLYRASVTGANNGTGNTTAQLQVVPASASNATTGSVIASGAQFEVGSVPTPLIGTVSGSVTVTDGHTVVNVSGFGNVWLLGADGAALTPGALALGALVRIIHDGTAFRMGAGKAIDAALLNGASESTAATANTVAKRDPNGGLVGNQLIAIGASNVFVSWKRTDAPSDSKSWDVVAGTTTLTYRILNDAGTVATDWLAVTRSGMTVTSINLLGPITFTGGYRETAVARSNTGSSLTLTAANQQIYTLTANATLNLPTLTEIAGDVTTLVIELLQDNTGGRTATWAPPAGQTIRWNGGSAPTINTTANKVAGQFVFVKKQAVTWWTGALIYKE